MIRQAERERGSGARLGVARRLPRPVAAALACLLFGGIFGADALGQAPPPGAAAGSAPGSAPAPSGRTTRRSAAPPSVVATPNKESVLQRAAVPETAAERLSAARDYRKGMGAAEGVVQQQLKVARRQRDVVRVLCLNDKLGQIQLALKSADDRLKALSSLAEAQKDRARHEFVMLRVLSERVNDLSREASQCVGEESGFNVDADVKMTVASGMPGVEIASVQPFAPPPLVPVVASGIE